MTQVHQRGGGIERIVWKVAFAVTVSSAALTKLTFSSERYWSAWFFGLVMGFNHLFGRSDGDHFGVDLAFWAWVAALTALIVPLLRLSARSAAAERAIRGAVGALAIAIPPLCLWLAYCYRNDWAPPRWDWRALETAVALICVVLIGCDLWPLSRFTTAALLVLHGAVWFNSHTLAFEVAPLCWRTVPITALIATLAWAYAFERERRIL